MPISFETSTGFLLSRLGSMSQRSWLHLLAEQGVTPHQHAVLLVLQERGPAGQQVLTRALGVDPRNLVAVIDGLAAAKLVDRTIDPADRRRRLVSLTPDGAAAATTLSLGAAAVEREFLAGLTDSDRQTLNRLLVRLMASLQTTDHSGGAQPLR